MPYIGADMIKEAREIERQKVLNELRDLIEQEKSDGGRYDGFEYGQGERDMKKRVLTILRRYGAES